MYGHGRHAYRVWHAFIVVVEPGALLPQPAERAPVLYTRCFLRSIGLRKAAASPAPRKLAGRTRSTRSARRTSTRNHP